ncbi:MAG: hypothetical protein EOP56_02370 [Sphingobacteriales bacterium]|nr:MAG: hypothetical protein EOP56_02370 [Sphingobacteriales bacterium]
MEHLPEGLKGEKLTAISFVDDDQIRMEFGKNIFLMYQWPVVTIDGNKIDEDNAAYRDTLTGLVDETVVATKLNEGESLLLKLSKAEIVLSLSDDEESFYFKAANGEWMVG